MVAVVLFLGIVALIASRSCSSSKPAPLPPLPSVAPLPEPSPTEDIPPPPPPTSEVPAEAAAPPRATVAVPSGAGGGCEAKCSDKYSTSELAEALTVRAQQARRCYNTALARDSTLKGKVNLSVRVGPTGNVCSVAVTSNDMGTPAVANCAANIFRNVFPAPKGGCVEANIPLNFIPQ